MIKRLVLCAVAAGLFAAAASPANDAGNVKMMAVVSFAGYDAMVADVDTMGSICEQPDLGKGMEAMLKLLTGGKGLEGLDKTRPCGILIGTDGEHVGGCAFVPVTNLDKLMDVVKGWARDRVTEHDGTYEIKTPKKTLYVKEQHPGWAFIVDDPEIFQYVPADPAKELDGLYREYDVALRINWANVPPKIRARLRDEMHKHAQKMREQHEAHHGEQFAKVHELIAEEVEKRVREAAADLDRITLGWRLDQDTRQGSLELTLVAKEGTPLARQMAAAGSTKTEFGGFDLPDAAVTGRISGHRPAPSEKVVEAVTEAIKARAYEKIDKREKSKEMAEAAKKLVDGLIEVGRKTAATGEVDGALSLRLDPEAVTLVAGRYVADGRRVEAAVKQFVEAARKEHPEIVNKYVKLNAAKYRDVNFHVVSIPIPEKCPEREKAVAAVGEELQIVLGFGPKASYLAAGRGALAALQGAIEESRELASFTVPPIRATVDLGNIADCVAKCGKDKDRERAEKAAELLAKTPGRDNVRLLAVPVPRGVKLRLVLEEGVLRLMCAAHRHEHHED